MPRLFSIRPGLSLKGRKFHGVRGWAGKPTHPPLTDFPIVCYVLAAAFDVISWFLGRMDGKAEAARDFFVAGTFVIVAGALVSLLTAITGFWDWWKGIGRDHSKGWLGKAEHTQVWRTINWHASIMLTVTAIVVIDVLIRLTDFQAPSASVTVTALSVIAGLFVSIGATYGGSLVYDYQFNVESLDGSTVWDETEQDQTYAEKIEQVRAEKARKAAGAGNGG